jgi:hypothetical protein
MPKIDPALADMETAYDLKTIAELRKEQYKYNYELLPYLREWKKNPYTWFKAKLYMEASAVLVYLLLKTKIKANTVTIGYIAMGILGGILLAIPSKTTIFPAILLFYFRGILDWSDGHYARITKQTSITGDILDPYGAWAGWISLWVGLGLNVASKSGMMVFYYLVPVIPALWAGDIWSLARVRLFNKYVSKDGFQEVINKSKEELLVSEIVQDKGIISTAKKMFLLVSSIFEHRARFVDLICLILVVEMFSAIFISWFVFLAFLVWQIVAFAARFSWVAKGGTVERELQERVEAISQVFNSRA